MAAASVPSASSTAEGDQASVVSVRKHSSGNDGTALPLVGETTEWDLRHRQAGLELDEATRAARLDEAMAAFSAGDGSLSPTTRRLAQFTANPAGKLIVITCGGTLFLGLGMLAIVLAGKFL